MFLRSVVAGLFLVSAGTATAAELVVEIRDSMFMPAVLSVKTGDTVRWINQEKRTSHSVLFLTLASFESERMFPGESWSYRFETPGEHAYRCGPHPEMVGKVLVLD